MTSTSNLTVQPQDDGSPRRVWGGMPPRNPHFTGRESLLHRLEQQRQAGSNAAVVLQALHGLGGVGKTQLAVEYVYRHAQNYDLVWWIPAEQPTQLLRSLAGLSRHLDLPDSRDPEQAASQIIEGLASTRRRWLLVYDNAGDPESLRGLVPGAGNGHVLVTSRNASWATLASAIEVEQAGARRDEVFICYSHADISTLDEIRVHLTALKRESSVKIWDDSRIRPGAKWRLEIERALSAARVALLLISPNFLASDFVMNEEVPALLRAAEDEGTRIVCLILRPCLYERFRTLSQFQAFNSPNQPLSALPKFRRERMLVSLVTTIEELLKD